MEVLLVVFLSYFIGNISTAYIMVRLIKKKDIRTMGSGNAGATNALRVYGKAFGAMTLFLDALKGVLAVYIGERVLGYNGALLAGVFVVIGHDWPILLGFKGGKGIATSMGMLLYLHWPTALACIILGIIIIILTRYVSLASLSAAALVPFIGIIMKRPFDLRFFLASLILGMMAIYKHKDNIRRLKDGRESKLGEKGSRR